MARPSKCTEAVTGKILAGLREGNFREVAAEAAGIDPGTLMRWMKRPREPYVSFRRAVVAAERASEMTLVGQLVAFAKKDRRAVEFLLERKWPERWGRRDKTELSGFVGTAPDLHKLTDDEVATWMRLQAKVAAE